MSRSKHNTVSVNYIKKQIARLKHINLKEKSIEEIKSSLNRLFEHYQIPVRSLDAITIYRARPLREGEDLFRKKEDVWYPPAHKVFRLGRLNNIGRSIFYCGNSQHTIIEEMRPKIGEQFVFIECVLKDTQQKPTVVELGIREAMENYHTQYKPLPARWHRTLEAERQTSATEIDQLIREFLAKEFMQRIHQDENYKYKMSVAIAELLLEAPNIDGIFYPSMELTSSAQNLALKPNAVDRLYRLTYCTLVTVRDIERLPNGASKYALWYSHDSKHIEDDGSIEWIELPEEENLEK